MAHLTLQLGGAIVVPFAPPQRMNRYRDSRPGHMASWAMVAAEKRRAEHFRALRSRLRALGEAAGAAPEESGATFARCGRSRLSGVCGEPALAGAVTGAPQ